MKIRNILLGGVAGIMIFMLASCGSSVKDATYYYYTGRSSNTPLSELVEDAMENKKEEAKDDDKSLTYSIKWMNNWDKEYLKDYREEHKKSEDKFKRILKENDIELVSLKISETIKDDDEKYKNSITYYLGRDTKKNVLFVAGAKESEDGELRDYDYVGAILQLEELLEYTKISDPFDGHLFDN